MTMPDDTTLPNPHVGLYSTGANSRWPDGAVAFQDVLSAVQKGLTIGGVDIKRNTQDMRAAVGAAGSPIETEWAKAPKHRSFPSITVSATPVPAPWGDRPWLERDEAAISTGLYGFDVDNVWTPSPDDRTSAEYVRDLLAADLAPEAVWVSASGGGVYAVFAGPKVRGESHMAVKEAHVAAWKAVYEERLADWLHRYGLDSDPAPKAVNSLRFVNYDPGMHRRMS